MITKPNYYAIIPAQVRYDNNISDKAKLLYGEITSLSNKEGYCYASNKYFANLYDCSESTISRLISQLHKSNHIDVRLEANTNRKIFLKDSKTAANNATGGKAVSSKPLCKNEEGHKQNQTGGLGVFEQHNIKANNKENTKSNILRPATDSNINNSFKENNQKIDGDAWNMTVQSYLNFYERNVGIKPKFEAKEAANLKRIILFLKNSKTNTSWSQSIDSLNFIFSSWDQLPSFFKDRMDVSSIYFNINNILAYLKNINKPTQNMKSSIEEDLAYFRRKRME
ncbi:helix-turn-helix domain-containing protein [Aureibacter tunicatorum]|uniref:Helix-turn-helix domain-containing protein n=1 Tax=Aureibacter tunicatorum TaxID=866807 RepID=A0AAE3XT15_9BACT|nr:helix-turn-helix domain-containing protein [Aureibacter tunicatorum]MDR6241910.1 hypothetical protein [Aureibacter tunicatorum]BDD07459.1 hypothetical protein AUTU_49420 [Aureibacter tunicatorum]